MERCFPHLNTRKGISQFQLESIDRFDRGTTLEEKDCKEITHRTIKTIILLHTLHKMSPCELAYSDPCKIALKRSKNTPKYFFTLETRDGTCVFISFYLISLNKFNEECFSRGIFLVCNNIFYSPVALSPTVIHLSPTDRRYYPI